MTTPPSGGPRVGQPVPPPSEADRWACIKAVFLEAVGRPESERSAFLDEACAGDPALRRDVESLLANDAAAGSFCDTPAAALLAAIPAEDALPRLQPGACLGAYEITGFIARGGMGEVYRARHRLLARDVAIKILGQATDPAAARGLVREARNASMLSHPCICTIYEVGESDDEPYIVMEYVRGRLLSDVVREQRPDLARAIGYGIQIADALEHAHRHGVVHRDLKSTNIMLSDAGRPVILDFGLARRVASGDGSETRDVTLTSTHAFAGTLSHMAPEVLKGATPDPRSDVWALGVVLYELVSGELPFRGRTQFEISSAILENQPRPLSRSVPLALRLIIARTLTKDRNARYASAADVRAALEAVARRRAWPLIGPLLLSLQPRTVSAAALLAVLLPALLLGGSRLTGMLGAHPRIATIAVVPFENATGDPQAQYYADGLTEGLIAQLGGLSEARIVPRSSALRLRDRAGNRADVARQLHADVLVEGALRRADDRIAIDVRLIDASTERVLWSESLARDARDVLALQADAAHALMLAMRVAVRLDAAQRLAVVRAVSPAAYEAYLRGRYEWNQRTPPSLQRAIAHFDRAVELDPTYAPAHAALADCYNQMGTVMVGGGSPRDWRPRAAAAAIRALQLDPHSAEAHAALGYVRHYEWQWQAAENSFRSALELNPSFSLARIWYANLLMSLGRLDEAVEQVTAAKTLDPFSLIVNANVGWTLTYAGRFDDAIVQLRHTLALDSTYVQARQRLATALRLVGRIGEAHAEAQRVVALTDSSTNSVTNLAVVYAHTDRIPEARALIVRLHARAEREYVPPWAFVHPYVALGDIDGAAHWMERGLQEGSNGVAYLAVDNDLAPLRTHPRVHAILTAADLDR